MFAKTYPGLHCLGRALCLVAAALPSAAGRSASGAVPNVQRMKLKNGIRVVVLHMADSKNVSIFTFLPMGLAADAQGQAQWSHLIEHLTIRSTTPPDSREANAETLPDHMRLDSYGPLDNWREGLSHHARWLTGLPFTEESLRAEKPKVLAECDFTARNLATHKFALAAWGQGYRHGQTHAALKGDVDRASVAAIQRQRDKHLTVLEEVVVCIAGGVDVKTARPAVIERLGSIESAAELAEAGEVHAEDREMSWDLDARHLVLTWPLPARGTRESAALTVAAHCLMTRCASDAELEKLTGMVLAGTDLRIPEGDLFYLSASLRRDASFDRVRAKLDRHLDALRNARQGLPEVPMLGRQLSQLLTAPMDPVMLKARVPPDVSRAMIEGNIGVQWGTREFRYGTRLAALGKQLKSVSVSQVHRATAKHLASKHRTAVTIRPSADAAR